MTQAFTVTLNGVPYSAVAASSVDALWIATASLARDQGIPIDEVVLYRAIIRPNADKAIH